VTTLRTPDAVFFVLSHAQICMGTGYLYMGKRKGAVMEKSRPNQSSDGLSLVPYPINMTGKCYFTFYSFFCIRHSSPAD